MTLPPLLPLRAIWLALPLLAGPAVSDAFGDASRPIQLVGSGLAWLLWALTFVAILVPRSVTLTLVRLAAPAAVVLTAWAALDADRPTWAIAGLVAALAATTALALPGPADAFVNGSSYGDEERVALRTPAALLIGPVALASVVVGAGLVAGPLLLAARQWVLGGILIAVGIPLAAGAAVRLHELSRRWLVFVPAGVVVHDPMLLAEPILFPRHGLASIAPAPVAGDAVDLTGGALGLALEIRAIDPISVGLRRGRTTVETDDVQALLVTPGRPAAVLEIASRRRLPVR